MSHLPGLQWVTKRPRVTGQIVETDMADAGMTVIRNDGLLGPKTIAYLESLPKADRSVAVGKMSRTEEARGLATRVTDGIRRRMEELLRINDVGEEEIVAVRRDAIVTSRPVRNLVLADGTTFRIKSAFTSFALLGKIEFYAIPARNVWDIRGIAQDRRRLHANGMALPLVDILGMLERGKVQEAADTLRGLRHDYLARRLPVDFYREFNADSRFCLRYGPAVYRLDEPDEIGIENLEIAYNLRFVIIPLVGVVLS